MSQRCPGLDSPFNSTNLCPKTTSPNQLPEMCGNSSLTNTSNDFRICCYILFSTLFLQKKKSFFFLFISARINLRDSAFVTLTTFLIFNVAKGQDHSLCSQRFIDLQIKSRFYLFIYFSSITPSLSMMTCRSKKRKVNKFQGCFFSGKCCEKIWGHVGFFFFLFFKLPTFGMKLTSVNKRGVNVTTSETPS